MPNDNKRDSILKDIVKLKALKIGYGLLTMFFIAVVQWLQEYFGIDLSILINILKL